MNSPLQDLEEAVERLSHDGSTQLDHAVERIRYQRDALLGLADHMEAEFPDDVSGATIKQWINQIRGILR